MRKFILMFFLILIANITRAQGYWKLESNEDDYTMEKIYMIVHYVGGNIDAVYFPADNSLRVVKTYDGLAYFDTAWDAAVKNGGKISSRITSVDYRFIITKDNYTEDSYDTTMYFEGYGDDGKIDTDGFFSYFYLPLEPDQLKKSNYLSLKYNDKVAGSIVKRISLAGLTKCYNLIK